MLARFVLGMGARNAEALPTSPYWGLRPQTPVGDYSSPSPSAGLAVLHLLSCGAWGKNKVLVLKCGSFEGRHIYKKIQLKRRNCLIHLQKFNMLNLRTVYALFIIGLIWLK